MDSPANGYFCFASDGKLVISLGNSLILCRMRSGHLA